MDVAGFVGFATRGPIDVPVPVEDVTRFRDVFGPPLALVRDRETGERATAHLHGAVESFFRNGGRRCWVVRVAHPADQGAGDGPTERASFGVPGLVSAETGRPAHVRARCYGASFDGMRVGTVLRRRLLPDPRRAEFAGPEGASDGLMLSWDGLQRALPGEGDLVVGDLLRLTFARLRVEVDAGRAPVRGAGVLLTLEVRLRRDIAGPVPLRLSSVRLVTEEGNVLATTPGVETGGPTIETPTVSGTAGETKQLNIRIDAGEKVIAGYEFVLPAEVLSRVEVTDVIAGGGTLTPSTAEVRRRREGGRVMAVASVAARDEEGAHGNREAQSSSRRVRTDSLRFFGRAPSPLKGRGDRLAVRLDVLSADGPSDPAPSSLEVTVRRTSEPDEPPTFRVVHPRAPEEGGDSGEAETASERIDLSVLEDRLVHAHEVGGGIEGWLQLGSIARRSEADGTEGSGTVVEIEVREALWPETGRFDTTLPPVHSVERQRFDLLAWKEQELRARLDHLGFSDAHPRGWTRLPVDDELFAVEGGAAVSAEPGTLQADVFEPRFPMAGPVSRADRPYIPLGMADRPDAGRTRGRRSPADSDSRLRRERLATFSPDLFVDDELTGVSTSLLAERADQKVYVDQEPAAGIHSLWSIAEVTLLAVPDAVHRGWDAPQPVSPDARPVPSDLDMAIQREASPPYLRLSWTVDRLGEDGVEVEVQEAPEPTFDSPVARYRGTEKSVDRYVRGADPVTLYFRYRVVVDGQPGPWSNTRRATLPEPDFDPCAARPEAPAPAIRPRDPTDDTHWLRWGRPSSSAVHFEIEVDTGPTFGTPRRVVGCVGEGCAEQDDDWVQFPVASGPPDGASADGGAAFVWYGLDGGPSVPAVRYVRMRAVRSAGAKRQFSPWSRTIRIVQPIERESTFIPKPEYDHPTAQTPGGGREGLLDVHRAMLRLGAARGDLLSVCALPATDESRDALRHGTRLRSPGAVLNADEMRTLSFGALYYPWLLGPAAEEGPVGPLPPDGAACGMIAGRTLRDGAWAAPAHIPLAGASAVVPPPSSAERADLEASPINVFAGAPEGVLTLGAATLARDPDLEPISTRRLLSLVRRLVQREGPTLVFENNTPLLRRRVAEQLDEVLRRLFDRGAMAGATPSEGYRIVADERVNPPPQGGQGRLVVELRVAPARPLTFLTVRLVQRSGEGPSVVEGARSAVPSSA